MTLNDDVKVQKELAKIGIKVDSIYDLVNTGEPYPEAIPVLFNLLKEVKNDIIKEGIVRSLAVKEAKGIGKDLIQEFRKISIDKHFLLWAFGITIDVVITKDELKDVIEIVKEKKYGTTRQMFVHALGKLKSTAAEDVLIELLDDDQVLPHAIAALGKLKSQKAKSRIEQLLNHNKSLIRKESQKALKKINNKNIK